MMLVRNPSEIVHIAPAAEVANILVIRQHNQLGDLLASSCVFRALKDTYPNAKVTVIVSPQNKDALTHNPYIDKLFIYDKKQLHLPYCLMQLLSVLNRNYDIVFCPFTVSISYTSNLLAKMARARFRFGVQSLDGKENKQASWYTASANLDWRNFPERHIAERSADFFRAFGVNVTNLSANIHPTDDDLKNAKEYLNSFSIPNKPIVGIHPGAGKIPNRWPIENFARCISELRKEGVMLYCTAGSADEDVIKRLQSLLEIPVPVFFNRSMGEIAALISYSSVFVTNDTGIMHLAGATETPQLSLFGPTPAKVWAPNGNNKIALQQGEDITRISVAEVLEHINHFLNGISR